MELEIFNAQLIQSDKDNFYKTLGIDNRSVGVYLLLTKNKSVQWLGISKNNFYDDIKHRLEVIGDKETYYITCIVSPKNKINKLSKKIVNQLVKSLKSKVRFIEIPYIEKGTCSN